MTVASSALRAAAAASALLLPPLLFASGVDPSAPSALPIAPPSDAGEATAALSFAAGRTDAPERDRRGRRRDAEEDERDERQLAALLDLYDSTSGTDWTNNDGWEGYAAICAVGPASSSSSSVDDGDDFPDPCDWFGIDCDSKGNVVGLNLPANNLRGRSPVTFWEGLPHLKVLDVSSNPDLAWTFHLWFAPSSPPRLKRLDVSGTATFSLDGISSFGLHLTHLDVSDCTNFGGRVLPPEIWRLPKLVELDASRCGFVGPILPTVGFLGGNSLRTLDLSGNDLSGPIPGDALASNELLMRLDLSSNALTGRIPPVLGTLESVEVLKLRSNELFGKLPLLQAFQALKTLDVSDNHLSGDVPPGFLSGLYSSTFDPSREVVVDLRNNRLGRYVPSETLDALEDVPLSILLSDNRFTDFENDVLCDNDLWLGNLGDVDEFGCDAILCPVRTYNSVGRRVHGMPCDRCDSNSYMGSTTCGNVGSDDAVDADEERSILDELFESTDGPSSWTVRTGWDDPSSTSVCERHGVECYSPTYVDDADDDGGVARRGRVANVLLPSNGLKGTIPSELFRLPYLKTLDVSSNPVDVDFRRVEDPTGNLRGLNVERTRVKTLIGIGDGGFSTLFWFRAGFNDLNGPIPKEVFDLLKLEVLNLSNCGLSGSIVGDELGRLVRLTSLDLSGNKLKGVIPTEIGNLLSLNVLNLGGNALNGALPAQLGLLTKLQRLDLGDQTSRAGNNGFTGPLPSFQSNYLLTYLNLERNDFSGPIPALFLSGIPPGMTDQIYTDRKYVARLSHNRISGGMFTTLGIFARMEIYLDENEITSVHPDLCAKSFWMDGNVGELGVGCDAILCPPGSVRPNGRQERIDRGCVKCLDDSAAPFWGSTHCGLNQPDRATERAILEHLYHTTEGERWINKRDWMNDDVSVCDWFGVGCDRDGDVVSISLGDNGLSGAVSSLIYGLPSVRRLALYGNAVDVSFSAIGQARELRSLLLDRTEVQTLDGIGRAASLIELNVDSTGLDGPFPSREFEKLYKLESFSCSNNEYTGTLPDLKYSSQLTSLRIASNRLSGPLFGYHSLVRIEALDLSGNGLTGTVPTNFLGGVWDVASPVFVDLSDNDLVGPLPTSLRRFPSLSVRLERNRFAMTPEHDDDPAVCAFDDDDGGEVVPPGSWNGGDVGEYGCAGLLCPPGTSNGLGRQSSEDTACEPCRWAKYWGTVGCVDPTPKPVQQRPSATAAATMMATTRWSIIATATCVLLVHAA